MVISNVGLEQVQILRKNLLFFHLVEMQPLRGAIVRAFSAKDAQDMLRVIALLEEFAAREACGAPQERINAVLSLHEQMREGESSETASRMTVEELRDALKSA